MEYKKCEICKELFPPTQIFRWDAKLLKKNDKFHNKRICNGCYQNLQTFYCKITIDGRFIKGRKFNYNNGC